MSTGLPNGGAINPSLANTVYDPCRATAPHSFGDAATGVPAPVQGGRCLPTHGTAATGAPRHRGRTAARQAPTNSTWCLENFPKTLVATRKKRCSDRCTRSVLEPSFATFREHASDHCVRLPACRAGATWDADPHWPPINLAAARCATWCRSQHCFASDRKRDRRHYRHHTAIDRQHVTIRPLPTTNILCSEGEMVMNARPRHSGARLRMMRVPRGRQDLAPHQSCR